MKRCHLFFVTLCGLIALFTTPTQAAVPQTINHQGLLLDALGNPVADGPHLISFAIYKVAAAGPPIWTSGFQAVTTTDGLFNYPLGSNVVLPDDLFTDTIRYLGITVDADPELTPRQRIRTVPYAYHALRADTAGIAATVFDGAITGPKLAANSVNSSKIVNGTITADDLGTNSVAAAEIQPNAVGNSEMQDNAIGSAEVMDNSLKAIDLGANSVGTSEVTDNSLTANDLAAGSVGSSELANNSVIGGTGGDIADGTITAADLAANSVAASEIAAGAVGASELATGSVVGGIGGDILDNTIHSADILNNTITGSDIATGSIFDFNLGDEPGVAQVWTSSALLLTGPIQTIISRTLTAPTSGYVLAIASCAVTISHSNGAVSAADFGISITTTFPNDQRKSWRISNLQPTGTRREVITVSRMFSVGSGSTTFRFLGDKSSGVSNHIVDDITLSLAFFPTLYGSFTLSPPLPPESTQEEVLKD